MLTILVTVGIVRSATSKTMTVMRIVSRTPTIRVTAGTFGVCDIKNDDSYENGASEASKTRTVTRILSWTLHPCDRSHFREDGARGEGTNTMMELGGSAGGLGSCEL